MVNTTVPVMTGREQPADLLDEHAHQHSHDAAHDHGAGNGRHSAAGGGDGCILGT